MIADDEKRNNVIRKVQALLDKASSTGFTAEAESYREKADELMTKFIIEEHELRAARPVGDRERPVSKFLRNLVSGGSPVKEQISDLVYVVADYCGVRVVYHGMGVARFGLGVTAYGFAAEVDYFEVLLTGLLVQMSRDMEPKLDPELSDLDNLGIMRGAGVPWMRAFEILGWTHAKGTKIVNEYRRLHPEQKHLSAKTYIRSFAEGFTREVGRRLRALKDERNQKVEKMSMALVLVDRSKEVNDFYDEATKGIRSHKSADQRLIGAGIARGREAGSRADLGQTGIRPATSGEIGS